MKKIFLGLGIILLLVIIAGSYWIYDRIQTFDEFTQGEVVSNLVNFEIPSEWVNSHIIVEAELDGQTHKFLFDTGAGNILFSNKIDISQYQEIGSASSTDSKGRSVDMPILEVPSLKIGDLAINDVTFRSINFNQPCYDDVVGIIGYNTMRHTNWQIDFENQKIFASDSLEMLNPVGTEIQADVNRFSYAREANYCNAKNMSSDSLNVIVISRGDTFQHIRSS